MKYMLVNVSDGGLQVDLHHPDRSYQRVKMHRMGPDVAINLPRGESKDILPFFDGSLERAHASVKHSRDILQLLKPHQLAIYVCDDAGNRVDIDKLFSVAGSDKPVETQKPKPVEPPKVESVETQPAEQPKPAESPKEDATKPDVELSEAIAAQDQFEAQKRGEANIPATFKKYKLEDLKPMSKKELVKLAKKLGVSIDMKQHQDDMIKTILGTQGNG